MIMHAVKIGKAVGKWWSAPQCKGHCTHCSLSRRPPGPLRNALSSSLTMRAPQPPNLKLNEPLSLLHLQFGVNIHSICTQDLASNGCLSPIEWLSIVREILFNLCRLARHSKSRFSAISSSFYLNMLWVIQSEAAYCAHTVNSIFPRPQTCVIPYFLPDTASAPISSFFYWDTSY